MIGNLRGLSLDDLRDFLICKLENHVGERDKSWNLLPSTQLGLGTAEEKIVPKIMYYSNKRISIDLTVSTKNDFQKKLFQLSHEVVHLLNPNGCKSASYFEEGFACYNSVVICEKYEPSYDAISGYNGNYKVAYDILSKLDNLYEVVREIRIKGTLSNFDKDLLLKLSNNKLSIKDVDDLSQEFYN